jgi:hypothetical protein
MTMTAQPHPTVTGADVERIVRRDCPADRTVEALAMLDEYGKEDWQREPHRVRLAALKLAAGDIKRLRYEVEGAKRDYRDVLGPAEYAGYTKHMCRIDKLAQDEQQRIIDEDWEQ